MHCIYGCAIYVRVNYNDSTNVSPHTILPSRDLRVRYTVVGPKYFSGRSLQREQSIDRLDDITSLRGVAVSFVHCVEALQGRLA